MLRETPCPQGGGGGGGSQAAREATSLSARNPCPSICPSVFQSVSRALASCASPFSWPWPANSSCGQPELRGPATQVCALSCSCPRFRFHGQSSAVCGDIKGRKIRLLGTCLWGPLQRTKRERERERCQAPPDGHTDRQMHTGHQTDAPER